MPVAIFSAAPVARIDPGATLHEAAEALVAAGVGALVVGTRGDPVGILTERDLLLVVAQGRDPGTTSVDAVAPRGLIWCDATATVAEVAEMMMERYVRHVLVERDGQLVGIVSARDLLGAYVSDDAEVDGIVR
jgi:CBS domain-containing protein